MLLNFIQGNKNTPRGHAVVLARNSAGAVKVFATYCVVLPISFSLGKYLPAFMAGQFSDAAPELAGSVNAMPLPPLLEEVPDIEVLLKIAELREDDVIEYLTSSLDSDIQKMELASQICNEYGQLYITYIKENANNVLTTNYSAKLDESPEESGSIDFTLLSPANDRDELGEVAKLVGRMRDAITTSNKSLVEETRVALMDKKDHLSVKYRILDLIQAAQIPGEKGEKLANLYIQRAYKLLEEDYASIPKIEEEIRSLNQ